jgi:hypothetical protein
MDKTTLKDLIAKGLTQREIADSVGYSHTNVRYWLKKYGLCTGKRICQTQKWKGCKCGEKDPSMFYSRGGRTQGLQPVCKKCANKAQVERFRQYKMSAVEYKSGACQMCGYNKCMAALDFHHVDPKEKDPLWKQMRTWSFERIKTELDKCILVCRNCHAEIHYGRVA